MTRIIRYPRFNDETIRISILYINIYVLFRNKSIINLSKLRISILISNFIFKLLTIPSSLRNYASLLPSIIRKYKLTIKYLLIIYLIKLKPLTNNRKNNFFIFT